MSFDEQVKALSPRNAKYEGACSQNAEHADAESHILPNSTLTLLISCQIR